MDKGDEVIALDKIETCSEAVVARPGDVGVIIEVASNSYNIMFENTPLDHGVLIHKNEPCIEELTELEQEIMNCRGEEVKDELD